MIAHIIGARRPNLSPGSELERGHNPLTSRLDEDAVARAATEYADALRASSDPQVEVLGPVPAPLARIRKTYRWQVIVDHMPVGVVGITLAAVFSAAMSTLSGSLNSSATAAVNDFYIPACRDRPGEDHLLRVSRALTVFFGLVQIGVGILGQLTADTPVVDSVLTVASMATPSMWHIASPAGTWLGEAGSSPARSQSRSAAAGS